uniref:Uncharacterized protein n=1 Tax=Anguilla anguilla TaxID=7936 RepID=A0A0E9WJT8_ANGAN
MIMAGTTGFFSNGPVSWTENDTEINNLYRDLELGTVLTLFYSKSPSGQRGEHFKSNSRLGKLYGPEARIK